MKKQILFVDDEINILKGLKRSLRPFRKYWEMQFVSTGEKALQLMDEIAFDVIVSDMRMPGMDGMQLLNMVQKKYPGVARIILSGHSDREIIMRSVKTAHQYLSKPCEKAMLVATIARACSLQDILNQKNLRYLLGGIATMPSMPLLYARILEELGSPDASMAGVAAIIEQDPGMTAKLLQLVNSSFFGVFGHILNVNEALVMLGMDVIRTLVLTMEVFSSLNIQALAVIDADRIRDHSVKTAAIARQIAGLEKMDAAKTDHAMMACFLHDTGKFLFAQYYPDLYREVIQIMDKEHLSSYEAEKKVFDVTHAELGAYLLGLWGLPDTIIEAIAFHHTPMSYLASEFELCGLIHVSELMEHQEAACQGAWEEPAGLDMEYMKKVGKDDKILLWCDYIRTGSARDEIA
jgi:putative nucleotidyltransferase with HDIG domain